MKRIANLLIALTGGTFGSISISNAYGEAACDLSTLQGQYVWTARADRALDDPQTNFPRIFAGALNFDGEGNFSGTFTASFGGTIARRGTTGGTYALNSDCMGSFNLDGKLDLVVANWFSRNVSVLEGKGDGTFQPAVNFDTADQPFSVAVGDLNGDRKPDLAVANLSSNSISVLVNNSPVADTSGRTEIRFPTVSRGR
jgi:hypothetical protein